MAVIAQQGGHHTINLFFSEWYKEIDANLSGVSPLSPHLRLAAESPLPQGRLTSSAARGRPPYAQLNMLTGRNHRGENHVVNTPHQAALSSQCPFFKGQGIRNTPSLGKWLQLTIMLITIAQNKSQAEKSLDGNCYNCPNNGNEYFSLLNYMWLNI